MEFVVILFEDKSKVAYPLDNIDQIVINDKNEIERCRIKYFEKAICSYSTVEYDLTNSKEKIKDIFIRKDILMRAAYV